MFAGWLIIKQQMITIINNIFIVTIKKHAEYGFFLAITQHMSPKPFMVFHDSPEKSGNPIHP